MTSETFARRVFTIAGVYGLLAIVPLFFLEAKMNADFPPPITHPEHYYGFAGVVFVWQILFFFIANNPIRYRTIMIPCMLEKLSLLPAFFILYFQGRFPAFWIPLLIIDLLLGVLFFVAYRRTGKTVSLDPSIERR